MDIIGILVLVISFFFLLVVGVPVAYSIGVAGILTMLVNIDSLPALTTYAMRMASGLDSFALLAIPFFILAGNIMNSGGIALRLIDFAKVLVGRLPGGLAVVNVVANMLFGAISGSAAAAASAIGSIMTPEMKKAGYDPNFSAAVNISSATTGMTIPPSNVLIVYSLASGGVSVSALFMAGYLPGILTGVAIMIVAAMFAARKGYPVGVRVPFSEATRVFFRAIPSLMLLVIVIGGILAGLFTATEASAIAVLYALILSFIYKELTWAKLPQVLLRSAKTTAIVLLLVATCTGLSWIMSYENIPQTGKCRSAEHKRQSGGHLDTYQRDPIDCRDLYGHDARCLDLYPDLPADSDGAIGDGPGTFRDHDGIEPLCGIVYATGGFGIVYRM